MQPVAYHKTDPFFTVYRIPKWRSDLYQFMSAGVWGYLPGNWQRGFSAFYARIYELPISRKLIKPYIRYYYRSPDYLDNFLPPKGKTSYSSFQDFFVRRFKSLPENSSEWVWPCEGLLCDSRPMGPLQKSKVKQDRRYLHTIFGVKAGVIPREYRFTNVFLHNKNYHRIHSPIEGTITRIQHIPGDLVVLRPWIYRENPSLPAFRNERYNIDITDRNGDIWYLSIVGGPAVGNIRLAKNIRLGYDVDKLEEISLFYLGSTCCMAAPRPPRYHSYNTFVQVGASY
ncbi:phosphatidylserine decarboxylase [Muriicola sp. E247]|uniref:phosphatidylserine decarboxylase n=1 Tax=Muriicola sp. E247 TaxID=3242730 RepID=UPI003525515A